MATGMITRHFDHPSGATATLEMPAGWSRNCYYILTTHSATNIKADVERKTFSTPEEARQAAIAREREALANGWRPRMAAIAQPAMRQWFLHRPTGEPIGLQVKQIESRQEPMLARTFDKFMAFPGEREISVKAAATAGSEINAGDRILLRQVDGNGEVVSAYLIRSLRVLPDDMQSDVEFRAVMTKLEPDEQQAIETWHDRASIIQTGIEDSTDMMTVWNWLGTRISDASEKQQVHSAILRGREERRARLRREQEARERSESIEAERQREAARRAIEVQVRRPLLLPKQPVDNTEETLRRLSGGTDLNKKKKRKINLGE